MSELSEMMLEINQIMNTRRKMNTIFSAPSVLLTENYTRVLALKTHVLKLSELSGNI